MKTSKITPISSPPANQTPDQILRLPEVLKKVGIGTTKLYELMALNQFPQSIPLGGRAKGWSMNELDAWIESRKAQRIFAA